MKIVIKEFNILHFNIVLFLLLILLGSVVFFQDKVTAQNNLPHQLWKIQSIDTMKTSRDKAREQLHHLEYDEQIQQELKAIKKTGANFVAIDTPYDKEFLPYLKRWVTLARKNGLHIWFRGNWSSWEGWFNYPKNMTPKKHLETTSKFINDNLDLFETGDIFDACPECEGSGYWELPTQNADYRKFLKAQKINLDKAFAKIGKNVITNIPSIIGGRAKEELDAETISALDNVVAIDHYVATVENMRDYIDYFWKKFGAKIVISEFGAPINDINGEMDESQQADFIDQIFWQFYEKKENILGVNYFVISDGSTALLNKDGSEKKAFDVIRDYYSPTLIRGKVTDSSQKPIPNVEIRTDDGISSVRTDQSGNYQLVLPKKKITLIVEDKFASQLSSLDIKNDEMIQNFVFKVDDSSIFEKIKKLLPSNFINSFPILQFTFN